MKTQNNNSVSNRFNEIAKNAKSEVKDIKKSPLFFFHLLEKLAKKQMKLENDVTDLSVLLKECGGKFTFSNVDIDPKTGKICKRLPIAKGKKTMCGTIDTYLGTFALCPVSQNEYGIIESIKCKLNYLDTVATDLSTDKKAAELEAFNAAAKIAAKEQSKKVSEAFRALSLGLITKAEFIAICSGAAA